jgi:chromosome segregation ATPase
LKKYQESRDQLHRDIEDLKREYESLRSKDQAHFDTMMTERREIESTLTSRETTISELHKVIKTHETHIHELNLNIDSLNDRLESLKDVRAQLSGVQAVNKELTGEKDRLRQELNTAGDFMLDLEAKVHKANNTSLELLRQLKDAEAEIEALKEYIIELKQRVAVYVPIRDDDVDRNLAEYINNYPDRSKLKIMFMRESEGIYLFGTRKIYVRVENHKIIIRVGGGYLSIDEFLDIYTPVELERLERKDPLKKFSEKVAV